MDAYPDAKRRETYREVEERLARNPAYDSDLDVIQVELFHPEPYQWYHRPVPLWLFLAVIVLGVFGVMFSIGLTLHEAYDAQTAMGEHVSAPPFNGLFETIHGWLAGSPNNWLWMSPNNWLW